MNLDEARRRVIEAVKNNATELEFNPSWKDQDESSKLSDSDIEILLPEILKLKNLKRISFRDNLLNNFNKEFTKLENLQHIDLRNNHLTTFNKEFVELRNLKILDLRGNQLTLFDKKFSRLENLERLYLSDNQLTAFDKEFAKLENLQGLDLENNALTEFDEEFANLKNLELLYLSHNQLTIFNKEFARLERLKVLFLMNNKLTVFDKEFIRLQNLKWLDLRENPLPFPTEILRDTKNPRKILNFIFEYYEAEEKGKLKPLNEAKLVVVGEANVGKTCVINRLLHNKFIKTSSTHGIEISYWKDVELEDGQKVQLNVWDFGGQEIMHSTHQFFFTKRTVYILVVNARENEDTNKTEEWLQRIQNLSQNSPVFIVGNKIDENNRGTDLKSLGYFDIERKRLLEKFPNLIKGFYGLSSDVNKNQFDFLFEKFKDALISEIGKLEEIHKEFPENWFEIKAQLEEMQAEKIPYITFQDYLRRCIKADIEKEESQRTLIDFMHDLGIALSFQDDIELRDLAVLNPEWVTRGVYALIDNGPVTLEKGILKREDISKYLNEVEYPKETQDFIIKMMRKFQLLIDIKNDEIFLIPDLLPKDEPDTGTWKDTLHFQYSYDIYEKSILRRFMVGMFHLRSRETYWRSGIVLKRGDNRALV
ncbi:MAG TPA: COR domain-containing protein, partial [Pyrinomonadaceae bacterium]|nr:COR domain-containing protein [Pyrinomonadaceae bacterium]